MPMSNKPKKKARKHKGPRQRHSASDRPDPVPVALPGQTRPASPAQRSSPLPSRWVTIVLASLSVGEFMYGVSHLAGAESLPSVLLGLGSFGGSAAWFAEWME